MTINRATLAALALALASCLGAQSFDPVEFFGEASFRPDDADTTETGRLHHTLSEPAPDWIRFRGSGEGSARKHFVFGRDGLTITPDDVHPSCVARIDVGVAVMDATFTIVSMKSGGAVAWHLQDYADPGISYLVNLMSLEDGGYTLSIQARTRVRYVDIPETRCRIESLDFPAELSASLRNGKLSVKLGDTETSTRTKFKSALIPGLAVTDKPAKLRNLSMDVHLHRDWIDDAAERLAARKALVRLREVATVGLLGGIEAFPYPGADEQLKDYSDKEREARDKARGAGVYDRANILLKIARAHADSSLAQHEAGVAALLAGHPAIGHERTKLAVELKPEPASRIAYAESCRRMGDYADAERALAEAAKGLPDELAPDLALIRGRLLADRGDIKGARAVLWKAREAAPDHEQLRAFADSADALLNPPTLSRLRVPGPLGLEILSDLPTATIRPLIEELEPYIARIRKWLPDLDDSLDGRIAIYAGPVQYLRAALLVAGDNLDHIAGMYMPHGIGGGPSVIACHAFGEDELLRTMVHELWHLALASTGRESAVPRWLNEGMAVFLSAGEPDGKDMMFDRLPSEFRGMDNPMTALNGKLIERALKARPQSFYVPGNVRENYLAAWAVAWYFAIREEDTGHLGRMLQGDEDALKEPLRHEHLAKAIAEALSARLK